MENNDKKKNNIIKELKRTPRGRAIIFFVGYFFFFLFLIVFVRIAGRGTTNGTNNYDKDKTYDFSISSISKNNYQFSHSVTIDDSFSSYVGKRYGDSDLFVMNNNLGSYSYYRNGVDYFSNMSGVWVKSNSPYNYDKFFDIENIMGLIDKSMLIYKTDYESGKVVYSFNVSTTTIHSYLEKIDLDIADDVNEIVVTVDSNDNVYEVEFKLDSYCKSLNICLNKMNIVLSYDQFGKVEEIVSPLNN